MAPEREETFTIGGSSPRVFHTTPPQPALKARTTLYSLSVGGAEASQKGLGDFTPAISQRRSAMTVLPHPHWRNTLCAAGLALRDALLRSAPQGAAEIGRESCRERACTYV